MAVVDRLRIVAESDDRSVANRTGLNRRHRSVLPPASLRWNDVPRGTMDEVSPYVRLDLPISQRQGRCKDCSTSSSNPMMEGPWCRVRREARARERHRHWSWWIEPLSCGRRWDRRLRGRLLALELLLRLLGPLLQLLRQLFLLLLELFGVSRRTVISLGEVLEGDDEIDGLPRAVDPLNDEALPFLQLADEFAVRLIIGHAAVIETDDVGASHGLPVVDDHA